MNRTTGNLNHCSTASRELSTSSMVISGDVRNGRSVEVAM